MAQTTQPLPKWFLIVASLALIWNLMGGWAFFYEINLSPEAIATLPQNQQGFYEDKSIWHNVLFAISVLTGIVGSFLLIMRKKIVIPIFTISLVTILLHDIYSFIIRGFYKVALPSQYGMPALVLIIALFLLWFSRWSHKKGWLKN